MSKTEGRKRRPWKIMLIVLGAIVGTLVIVALVALGVTEGERREGRNLSIADVDFSAVPDGTYTGTYAGGKYGWRANTVAVSVSSGKVTGIKVMSSASPPAQDVVDPLFASVIKTQSLQVDTISGATITSKALLKSIENALNAASKP